MAMLGGVSSSGRSIASRLLLIIAAAAFGNPAHAAVQWPDAQASEVAPTPNASSLHREVLKDPWMPRPEIPPARSLPHCGPWMRGPFASIQVNTDANGCNILGDAANEPSIAVDPTNADRFVIGWRQFDSVQSDFRQAGYAYSHDGGGSWTFPGSLAPGVFGSDPVLAADPDGAFYYLSVHTGELLLFKSLDGGVSWGAPTQVTDGFRDKPWMAIDQTAGPGRGYIYVTWRPHWGGVVRRSMDRGATFATSGLSNIGSSECGTLAIGAGGELYASETPFNTCRDVDPYLPSNLDVDRTRFLDRCARGPAGSCVWGGIQNPDGLAGQTWIAADHSNGPLRGNVYTLFGTIFQRSGNRAGTWSPPIRVDNDPRGVKWFGTLSVAPNGRIDVVWNDTRNAGTATISEVYHASSRDGGLTWSRNVPVSPAFDSTLGWPGGQRKIGDYYHMVSLNDAAYLAYAATFNGEQDIYFLRIPANDCDDSIPAGVIASASALLPISDCATNGTLDSCKRDCNANGKADRCDIALGGSADCTSNGIPDECEADCNGNDVADSCEIASGAVSDCNRNGSPDDCDVESGLDADCNGNGRPDSCDLDDRTARDCGPRNTVPDSCDGSFYSDCNHNCVSDRFEIRNPAAVTIFATGFEIPEEIVASQGDFPPGFFVPEAYTGAVRHVSPDGKTVTTFVDGFSDLLTSATFVPDEFGGKGIRLAVGGSSTIFMIQSDRTVTMLQEPYRSACGTFAGLIYLATSGDPLLRNRLVSGCYTASPSISVIAPDGSDELIANTYAYQSASPFAVARAPAAFGARAWQILLSHGSGPIIYQLERPWLKPFIRVPYVDTAHYAGLRHMAFSPPGWAYFFDPQLRDESVLVVSRSGNSYGGLGGGGVQIWDSRGRMVAELTKGPDGLTIDPRGLLFVGNDLLISDSKSGSVLKASLSSFPLLDCNFDGAPDACETGNGAVPDCNGNGIPDSCELTGDGKYDCNSNGMIDSCEVATGAAVDCNLDLILDECTLRDYGQFADCNRNGRLDPCDALFGPSEDCDHNIRPDECDPDFDGDLINDGCDDDIDNDGVPNPLDMCDRTPLGIRVDTAGRPLGDIDGNCQTNVRDFRVFLNDYWSRYGPGGGVESGDEIADFDGDGEIDLQDFALFSTYLKPP